MPITPSFTVSNNNVTTSTFTVTDTSTGTDPALANRLIFLYASDNSLLTGAPIPFPLAAGTSISLAILTEDAAYNVVLQWVNASNGILASTSLLVVFTGYLEWFYYSLTQQIAARPAIMNDTRFLSNYSNLRNFIDSANQSITIAGSIVNSEGMILLAQNLQDNQNLYF